MIVESGVLVRLDENPYYERASRIAYVFDVGWMKNISPRDAVGFTGYALVSDPTQRLGLRARYRRWLSSGTSIDVSPGILLSGEGDGGEYSLPGFALGATVNAGDLIGLTADVEWSRTQDLVHDTLPLEWRSRSDVAWRVGGKLGSSLGLVGGALFVGLIIVVIASGATD